MARNQFSSLPNGLLTISFQGEAIGRLVRDVRGQFITGIQPAILDAHDQLSFELQRAMQRALRKQVDERGRAQRGRTLFDALVDERNRKVNIYGFGVGYLEDIPEVSKYWRRIELGDIGAGIKYDRWVYGFFRTAGGKLVGPNADREFQVDPRLIIQSYQHTRQTAFAINLNRAREGNSARTAGGQRLPAIHIKNPIPAYHYLKGGRKEFLRSRFEGGNQGGDGARRVYIDSFRRHGLDFLAAFLERNGVEAGRRPFMQ